MQSLKKYFFTGLVLVVPVSLTIYLLVAVFRFIDSILGRFINEYLYSAWGFDIPGIGFVLFFLILVLVGFLASRFVGQKLFVEIEKWFANLPLIKTIYPTLKQIVSFISAQKEFGFKRVVLIEYPGKGLWSLGFLTNEGFKKINDAMGIEMAAVYVSTVPGPLTGTLVFVPKDQIRFPDIAIVDALKIIISGGVVNPATLEHRSL
ncbi:MAG TPA: DUF502 domain-containing protein [Candidatus Omnitrophota bacterium]|nr:DUF502 domain-containing protein [Candidatus Omnitrophota bacterium]HNQ50614.1 DUF502 domain-containing protein [Candidatus Omnitrophota bacterium]HQO38574.1 DUF502 domain-containing protein [Candidatus Omnitrophota bacterium]HQQ06169.1 DUF502 domain-containing protein [Candidatus Omnitrophota bacterium]